jgi:NAD(P)-dependent dehydrogenase (short-subunit alcohol dehydrogenase family)
MPDTTNATEPTIDQLFDLTGRVALLTGASGHLGSAFARALAEAGASVVAASREIEKAKATVAALPGKQKHYAVELDQMKPDSLQAGFAKAKELAGGVDILVNNGHAALGKDLTTVTQAEFAEHLGNAAAYFELARLTHDDAVQRGKPASIIMLGSMYGQVASYPDAYADVCPASPVPYHALKGGILQMTRHLAVYWARDRVRVNALSPGPFPSHKAPAEMVTRLITKSPMQRMGHSFELKGAIVFLASDASSYMTGQNLTIDGGWTAW